MRAALLIACVAAAALAAPGLDMSTLPQQDFITQWFHVLDGVSQDGTITPQELADYYFVTGASHGKSDAGVARSTFSLMDGDGDGGVSHTEFTSFFADLTGMTSASPNASGIHLAVTNDVTEMRVMWVTQAHEDNGTLPVVQVGTTAGHYGSPVTGNSVTYTIPPRWWGQFNGQIHDVLLTGLAPSTTYFYRVGNTFNGTVLWNAPFSFVSAPVPSPQRTTKFAVYGDMGTIPLGFLVTKQIVDNLPAFDFDAVMHVGDIAYAGIATNIPFLNITSDDEWEFVWDIWFQQVQPFAATRPYMAGVGNHESFYNWTAFSHRFNMPADQSLGNGNFWYSYDYGNIHFTSLSTEHPYNVGSPQWLWAKADLAKAAANRATVPWIIVTGHRPMYCSDADEYSSHEPGAPFQVAIEPLLLQYGVDMTITGHQHCYERVHPVKNGTVVSLPTGTPPTYVNPSAPLHLVVGTSGALQRETFIDPQPTWSAVRGANWISYFGYGQLTTHNSTHLQLLFSTLDGSKGDEFWIVKA